MNVHNIKKEDTMEEVGRSMPCIYAALQNRQEDYQSHMIEVEGDIDNHPICNVPQKLSQKNFFFVCTIILA
jgi:hypothetical protein